MYSNGLRSKLGVYETKIKRNTMDLDEGRIVLSRVKRRWSVVDDVRGVRIDLTEATTSGVRSHEVEVEAVHGKGNVNGFLSTVGSIVEALGTFKGPHHAVRTVYMAAFGLRHPMFVGAQPKTLHIEHVKRHADGTANVMPRILEDYPLATSAAAGASTVAPVRHVLDVEVNRIGRTVRAFDLLLHDGKDLRGNWEPGQTSDGAARASEGRRRHAAVDGRLEAGEKAVP
ncbi:hypothetical protein HDU89_000571 [Geranomyces variabilis]|nr:hypothetical protein HDU89_000571 [Geranomyces variabilis]